LTVPATGSKGDLPRTGAAALVLGSGGARGAYEVGVLRFLFEDLARELGGVPRIDVICGTSAGALNALGLAAFIQQPQHGVAFLASRWRELRLDQMVQPRRLEIVRLFRSILGCPAPFRAAAAGGGRGILDPRPFWALLSGSPDLDRIGDIFRKGYLDALAFTATEIATGQTTVFVQRSTTAVRPAPSWGTAFIECDDLGPRHALASAAIPFLFRPVRIGGRLFCDGSLRQSVPLSPALHLGAERLVVVSTQHQPVSEPSRPVPEREAAASSPVYLLGKAINALTLDRIDDDLHRLDSVNRWLEAGQQACGGDFVSRMNERLAASNARAVRPVQTVLIRPSESLGRLAADYVRGAAFRARQGGSLGTLFGRLSEAEASDEADLISYLMFDGGFATTLMELGYHDARKRGAELTSLFQDQGCRGARQV